VYVSLSRLTCLQGLVLKSRISSRCISTDSRVVNFVKQELEEDALQQTLEQQQKVYVHFSLMQSFTWEKIHDTIHDHLESYEDRQLPDKEKCIEWAGILASSTTEQKEVADKFKSLLSFLLTTAEQDGYRKLYERTDAATKYFISELDNKLYKPIQQHIEKFKDRQRVKKYINELQDLIILVERKKQQLQQGLQLAEALQKSTQISDLLQLVEQSKKGVAVELPKDMVDKTKPEKGESNRISLQMFKQGKSIADISVERGFSQSTIEGHLASFVTTGEVDILDLVDNQTLMKIIAMIEADADVSHSAIKAKVEKNVSYNTIRAVLNYMARTRKEPVK
jgi:hypothetical protein